MYTSGVVRRSVTKPIIRSKGQVFVKRLIVTTATVSVLVCVRYCTGLNKTVVRARVVRKMQDSVSYYRIILVY